MNYMFAGNWWYFNFSARGNTPKKLQEAKSFETTTTNPCKDQIWIGRIIIIIQAIQETTIHTANATERSIHNVNANANTSTQC
ncbi:hypothetical protein EPI10_010660 [Gossypium australe]|uniref:Uncharacterized protein n=1 Tax=Gossypium australe TaxID=47621 RepID=A0A5B6W604_9ROSI|nr:hypothetical protein EPI10_010660 [Gossypium australe]